MTVDIPLELEAIIQNRLRRGNYSSEEDMLREAITLLERRDQLRDMVRAGVEQLNRGEYTEYDEGALRRFQEDILAEQERISAPNRPVP